MPMVVVFPGSKKELVYSGNLSHLHKILSYCFGNHIKSPRCRTKTNQCPGVLPQEIPYQSRRPREGLAHGYRYLADEDPEFSFSR